MEGFKALIDTNVVLEYLLNRAGATASETILRQLGKNGCVLSLASFYTITYYVEIYLKKQGVEQEARTALLRKILNSLLKYISIASINEEQLSHGINNPDFKDLEDSYQLETAKSAGCSVLITNNIKDFKGNTDTTIKILTPEEFLSQQ